MGFKLGIRDVTEEDFAEISLLDLMDDDKTELYNMGYHNIPVTLTLGCKLSMDEGCVCRCYYELDTGKILGVYGITNIKTIWFLSSKDLLEHYKEFTKRTKKEFNYFTEGCGEVYNYVHTKHKRALRWLKWLGFKQEGDPVVFNTSEEQFVKMIFNGG